MKTRIRLLLAIIMSFTSFAIFAQQQITITGAVKDTMESLLSVPMFQSKTQRLEPSLMSMEISNYKFQIMVNLLYPILDMNPKKLASIINPLL